MLLTVSFAMQKLWFDAIPIFALVAVLWGLIQKNPRVIQGHKAFP